MIKRRIRAARSNLLWSVVGFISLQVALLIAIEYRYPQYRDPDYGHKITRLQQRTIHADPKPLTIVMLGSSRTRFGLKAGTLERPLADALGRPVVVFNFGINAAGPVVQLMNLNRILAGGVRPDLLLVEVLPPLLAGQVPLHEVEELMLPAARLGWRDLPLIERYSSPDRQRLNWNWFVSSLVPWYTHRFAILSDVYPYFMPDSTRIDLFMTADNSGDVDINFGKMTPERARKAVQFTHDRFLHFLQDFRVGGGACEGLRELLDTCRREQIPAALVLMPEGEVFRSWYSAGAWRQVQTFLDDLSREYRTPLISTRDWMPEKDFPDSHHLLGEGAAVFTERFGKEAILPLLREDTPTGREHSPGDLARGVREVRR